MTRSRGERELPGVGARFKPGGRGLARQAPLAPTANADRAAEPGEAAPGGAWRLVSGPHREHHASLYDYIVNENLATGYDRHFRDNELFEFDKRFLEEVLPASGELLDLGCGTGRHLLHFARRGWRVAGVDLAEPMLREAAAKLAGEERPARLYRADILDLSFLPAGSFDAAICMFSTLGMLQSAELRRRALLQAVRCLRPGGVYAAHVHNRLHFLRWLGGRTELLARYARRLAGGAPVGDCIMRSYRGELDLYLHSFGLGELLALLRGAGLEVFRALPLNEHRDGEAVGLFDRITAHGFLVAARRPGAAGQTGKGDGHG